MSEADAGSEADVAVEATVEVTAEATAEATVEAAVGVVVGHGAMAQGLVDAAQFIAGDIAECLAPLSNDRKSPEQLRSELDLMVGSTRSVVFVDLHAGSCGMAALVCCRDSRRRVAVSGVNLPMLLDFVFNRGRPFDELVPRLLDKGRAGIEAISTSQ